MLSVVWLASARDDLAKIICYIAAENPTAAKRLKQHLQEAILPTSEHPYLYRQSERISGLREIVAHPNYVIYYRVAATCIEVVSVVHARQEYPPSN